MQERTFSYRGSVDVNSEVELGYGHRVDFSPVILHPSFNRLRYVGQLAPIDLIIPGAHHKRYEHCVGVFDLTQQIISRSDLALSEYEKFLLLSIALLHDIGHGPYSHVYDLVAKGYGLPDHKEYGLRVIEREMGEALREAGRPHFNYNRVVDDLVEALGTRSPLARLVTDKDRPDKWDYTVRDWHYCRTGSLPDIETLVTQLYFDGERSAIGHEGRDALRAYFEALVDNNTRIYIRKDVEIIEGFLMRAMIAAMDQGFGLEQGRELTDEELNRVLMDNPESRQIFESIRKENVGSKWAPVASIKPEKYGWVARASRDDSMVQEATDAEISQLNSDVSLPGVVELERKMRSDMSLEPDDVVVTFSPQIDRLAIGDSLITYPESGERMFKSIFELSPGLDAYLRGRLKEHYSIEIIASQERRRDVLNYVERHGGPKDLLRASIQ